MDLCLPQRLTKACMWASWQDDAKRSSASSEEFDAADLDDEVSRGRPAALYCFDLAGRIGRGIGMRGAKRPIPEKHRFDLMELCFECD